MGLLTRDEGSREKLKQAMDQSELTKPPQRFPRQSLEMPQCLP